MVYCMGTAGSCKLHALMLLCQSMYCMGTAGSCKPHVLMLLCQSVHPTHPTASTLPPCPIQHGYGGLGCNDGTLDEPNIREVSVACACACSADVSPISMPFVAQPSTAMQFTVTHRGPATEQQGISSIRYWSQHPLPHTHTHALGHEDAEAQAGA